LPKLEVPPTKIEFAAKARMPHVSSHMKPVDLQVIGEELAVKWDDGSESYVKLERLRRACPCAGCKGETDVMGNLYKAPDQPLSGPAFQCVRITSVGGYGVQPLWADGHGTGIYSFDYLRSIAEAEST
jgi:DUF971 family protein